MEIQKIDAKTMREGLIKTFNAPVFGTDEFLAYHTKRPEIWKLFEQYALEAWNCGRRKYTAQGVIHRVRWSKEIEQSGDDFLINNKFIAYYARVFMLKYPEAKEVEFFETREFKEIENGNGIDGRYEKDNDDAGVKAILPDIQPRHETRAGLDSKESQQSLFPG
jgi:hypothetical protein